MYKYTQETRNTGILHNYINRPFMILPFLSQLCEKRIHENKRLVGYVDKCWHNNMFCFWIVSSSQHTYLIAFFNF